MLLLWLVEVVAEAWKTTKCLDDEDLINTLAESKKVSIMIGKRMEAAVVTKQEIDEAREAYRTVATRGSIIYFVIADMAQIDPMYQCDLRVLRCSGGFAFEFETRHVSHAGTARTSSRLNLYPNLIL